MLKHSSDNDMAGSIVLKILYIVVHLVYYPKTLQKKCLKYYSKTIDTKKIQKFKVLIKYFRSHTVLQPQVFFFF